jgi:beta-lactamase regulating signal transducer with metallopeptidase domain
MNISPHLQSLIWLQVWQVTLLVVVVGFVAVTTLRRRPHVAYLLWALLFVKCLMPPLWSSPTGVFSWIQESPYTLSGTLDTAMTAAPGLFEGSATRQSPKKPPANSSDRGTSSALVSTATHSTQLTWWQRLPAIPLGRIGFTVWIAGTGILSVLALLRFSSIVRKLEADGAQASPELEAALQRLVKRLGVKKQIRLVISPDNSGPLIFGYRRPLIVSNSRWSRIALNAWRNGS